MNICTKENNKYIHEIYKTPDDSLFDEKEARDELNDTP